MIIKPNDRSILRSSYRLALLSIFLLGYVPSHAQDESLWELGIGIGAINFPAYLGSDQRSNWLLPLPYVVYRSKWFDIDREQAASELLTLGRIRLRLSLSGSVPGDGDANDAREGMPNLDPVAELGPSLQVELYGSAAGDERLLLDLPVRGAFALSLDDIRHIGWVSTPMLRYQRNYPRGDGSWTFNSAFGPLFGDQRYYSYFYAVEPRFATPDRPEFATDAGFGGWRLALTLSYRSGKFWYGGFIRYFNLNDVQFEDSPLVETTHSLIAGVGIAWIFASSASKDDE